MSNQEEEIFQSGEKELKMAFEKVTTQNVRMIYEYSAETRKLFRELEQKVKLLQSLVQNQSNAIERMTQQLADVQNIVFRGGT